MAHLPLQSISIFQGIFLNMERLCCQSVLSLLRSSPPCHGATSPEYQSASSSLIQASSIIMSHMSKSMTTKTADFSWSVYDIQVLLRTKLSAVLCKKCWPTLMTEVKTDKSCTRKLNNPQTRCVRLMVWPPLGLMRLQLSRTFRSPFFSGVPQRTNSNLLKWSRGLPDKDMIPLNVDHDGSVFLLLFFIVCF